LDSLPAKRGNVSGDAQRKFKSVKQAQRFLGAHAAVSNLFNLGRDQVSAEQYRDLRMSAFGERAEAVARDSGLDSAEHKKLTCRYRH
jgi:putative transposase